MNKEDYYAQSYMEKYKNDQRELEQREIKSLNIIDAFKIPAGGRFLDVGCGDGFFLQAVADRFGGQIEYYGGEYSEYQREKASRRGNLKIYHLDLEDCICFSDLYFDFVYSGEVIEHLYNPDLLLKEVGRILKPGGGFVITTPNMNSWVSRVLFFLGLQPLNYECSTVSSTYGYAWLKWAKKQDWPVGHVRLFNRHSISDMLRANGFEIVQVQGAVFEFMPRPLRWLDRFFSIFPSLASGLVILAKKI